jgi:acyl-CoA reductase-like NAD-dependent aldehyde dehydrogenase
MVDWHLGTALKLVDSIAFEEKTAMGAIVVKEPIGVVGCITPWNYPLNQIAAKIFPAMLVGCTVVLKPSEVTPVNAYLLAEAIHDAGVPPGVFNMVLGTGPVVGEVLSAHPDVDMISFTGSTRAGMAITKTAAATLKVVRTELGGKSAALMLDDADLPKLMPEFIGQLMSNTGQSCNALSRMVVPKARYEEAVGIAKKVVESSKAGRSSDPSSVMGPLVSQTQWERVQGYLQKGIDEGARVVTGGPGKPEGLEDGYYVKPTVFADVNNKMLIAQEEIFGPVLSIIPYGTEQEGIDIANDTVYGLNNAVGSSDPERALRVARQLRSGTVMINGTAGKLDAPFGGYKQSGNAREWGKFGLEEYLVTKHLAGAPPSKL